MTAYNGSNLLLVQEPEILELDDTIFRSQLSTDTKLGRAYECARMREQEHGVPIGTYGSNAILDAHGILCQLIGNSHLSGCLLMDEDGPAILAAVKEALQ